MASTARSDVASDEVMSRMHSIVMEPAHRFQSVESDINLRRTTDKKVRVARKRKSWRENKIGREAMAAVRVEIDCGSS